MNKTRTLFTRLLISTLFMIVQVLVSTTALAVVELQTSGPQFSTILGEWNRTLDQLQKQIDVKSLDHETADDYRLQLAEIRETARKKNLEAVKQNKELKRLFDALGPPAAEGEPPEAAEVANDRAELDASLREIERQIKQSGLVIERSDQLLRKISTVEMGQMVSDLSSRGPVPLDPRIWMKAGSQFVIGYGKLFSEQRNVGYEPPLLILTPVILLGVLLSILAGKWLRRGKLRHYMPDPAVDNPTYGRRVLASLVTGFVRGVVPVMVFTVIVAVTYTYWLQYVLNPEFVWPKALVFGVIFYLIVSSLIRGVFAPELPQWNITWVTAQASKKIGHRLYILTALIAIGIVFEGVLMDTGQAPEFGSVYALIKNSLIAILLLSLGQKSLWQPQIVRLEGEETDSASATSRLWFWPYLRITTVLIAAAAIVFSLLGYHNIADFILTRIVLTGLLAALFTTMRVLIRESLSLLLERETGFASSFRRTLDVDISAGKRLTFWLLTIADLILILIASYLLLIIWKLPHQDVTDWLIGWFKGFSIGSYTFSLADLLLAVVVLVGVLGLFRVIKSLLQHKLLPQTSLSIGVRTAISSGVGYFGALIAILAAISTLGLDMTKLALIAGALSVGIGFGLQNIVNNFVSGLILLFERPLQIDDWVVVGAIEGKVKQINVRSTEIETFSRASVIIPNADMIQTALVNWTHKSSFGRVEVPVGVSYSSDVDLVEQLLLECARERSEVLAWPEPYVYLLSFGDSSLNFQLYAFIENIEHRLRVSSALRKDIVKKFRSAGIEIPFPQRVVTIHNGTSIDSEGPVAP